ncbi:hypothetical protein PHYBOEH_009260 [Phytophthora boehmeriae]|uniref:G domain-containing protein n=1 Tax=Phytophthora boehmeriae TaxID=109152 RepID=A0A8T1VV87_9STRA|nr:hypothetical protein PHYBOEH_009260 [Phytophthora boehmeriae]
MATPSNQQDNDPMPKSIAIQNFVFLGNPGTGKSTLINCLVGRAIFDSGVSYGEGLTKHFQTRTHENVKYMDTPGLADRHIQESAAAAITEALKQSGNYKLFFMVRLENGRVVSDDLATIEIVLNSIELDEIPFSIIINNVKKRQYAQMMEKGADFLKVVAVINSIKHTTPHIVLIPVLSELDEEDNAVVDLPGEVESFIRFEAPVCEIPPEVVKPIKIEDFKKTSEALREAQEQLLRDNAALERRVASSRANLASFEAFLTKWKTSSTPRRAISFQMKTLLTLDSPEDILAATIRSTVNIRCQHPSSTAWRFRLPPKHLTKQNIVMQYL